MKDLLLYVHVVFKTLNLEISRCHLADYVKEFYYSACRTCSTIIFPHSANQIIVFWRRRCRCRRPCSSSLFEVLMTTRALSSKSFILWLYMKTIRSKHAKMHFAYFVQRDQLGKIAKQLT